MLTSLALAERSLLAYEQPLIIVGNAACRVDIIEGYSVVSIAGTDGFVDGIDDILWIPWKPAELAHWVHLGFWVYLNKILKPILAELYMNGLPVIFTGHSLGGVAACYGAAVWTNRGNKVANLTTFGSPRGCSAGVVRLLRNVEGHRFVRDGDQVTWFGMFSHHTYATPLDGDPSPIDHPLQGYIDMLSL